MEDVFISQFFLKFIQAPQSSDPWDGVLDATDDAPVCLQYDSLVMFDIVGVENCLTLNLYTPKVC